MNLGDLPARAFDSGEQQKQTAAVYARYNELDAASPEVDAEFGRIGAERIAAHPLRYYVGLPMAREADMWFRPRTELMKAPLDWWKMRAHPKASGWIIAYGALNVAYLALAFAGVVRWRRSRWSGSAPLAVAMFGFVTLRCLLLLTLDNSEPRYTLECFPVVVLLAGFALARREPLVPGDGGLRVRLDGEG